MSNRRMLVATVSALTTIGFCSLAEAQIYPSRPVRVIVGFPPGGAGDILARLTCQWLSERVGQPFVVENRPGAAGNTAAEAVVKAAPDGYTLYWSNSANAISATLYENLNFNFVRDFAAVAGVMRGPLVMEVHPSVPARTVPEFIAYAKGNYAKLNMASNGNGTTSHLAGELFKMMATVNMVHVPYRGAAPALTDLIGGQVHVMFDNLASSIEHLRAGKLRALAVTSAARSDILPDIPTVGESVTGYEASAWFGVAAPRNTPANIINTLNKEINAGLADPRIKARLVDLGGTVLTGSPADFGKLIAEEVERWGKVVKTSDARPD